MKNQSENKVYTLAEVLGKHTIAELKQMTQVLEVKVLSKAKKQEIIDALSAMLLDKELLTAWLLAAGKQEKRSPQGDKFQLEFHGIRI